MHLQSSDVSKNALLLRVKTAATRLPEGTAAAGVPHLVPLAGGNEAREDSCHDRHLLTPIEYSFTPT